MASDALAPGVARATPVMRVIYETAMFWYPLTMRPINPRRFKTQKYDKMWIHIIVYPK